MARWWPAPQAGDIVDCRFPHDKVPGPGPKERPALVTKIDQYEDADGQTYAVVEVAYGTSQNTSQVYPGEFVVNARHPGAGLNRDTKFDLGNVFRLPCDDEWFAPAAPPHPTVPPKRGKLDPGADQIIKRKIHSAVAEARTHGRLKAKTPKSS